MPRLGEGYTAFDIQKTGIEKELQVIMLTVCYGDDDSDTVILRRESNKENPFQM